MYNAKYWKLHNSTAESYRTLTLTLSVTLIRYCNPSPNSIPHLYPHSGNSSFHIFLMPSRHYVLQNYVPVKLNSTQRWKTDASAMPLCSNWNENFEHSNAKTVSAIQTNQFYIYLPSDLITQHAMRQEITNKYYKTKYYTLSPRHVTLHTKCKEYVTFAFPPKLKQHQCSLKSEKARVVNFSNSENIKHGNRVRFRRCSVYT